MRSISRWEQLSVMEVLLYDWYYLHSRRISIRRARPYPARFRKPISASEVIPQRFDSASKITPPEKTLGLKLIRSLVRRCRCFVLSLGEKVMLRLLHGTGAPTFHRCRVIPRNCSRSCLNLVINSGGGDESAITDRPREVNHPLDQGPAWCARWRWKIPAKAWI